MTLPVDIAQTPDSWGIERPHDPAIASWPSFLDQVREAGYSGVELGPLGYLPTQPDRLREALDSRNLTLVAGYVMRPWSDEAHAERTLDIARDTCGLLAEVGAEYVVMIDALGERANVAGQADAPRLYPSRRRTLVDVLHRVARLARDQFDLIPVFHPHAGTYVEFEDEIAWLLEMTDPELIALCLDTGHCLFSGIDPVDLCRRHASRLRYVHLKDVDQARLEDVLRARGNFEAAVEKGVFCRLGEGGVDFEGVADALRAIGYTGWASVEQDRLPRHPDDRAPFDDANAAKRFLGDLGFGTRRPDKNRT
jgi:inosose dehydratase